MANELWANQWLSLRKTIFTAASSGRPDVISSSLAGLNPNFITGLLHSNYSVSSIFRKSLTPLMLAAAEGHSQVVLQLLDDFKVDVNQMVGCSSALSCAAENGHLDTVKILVEKGAEINRDYVCRTPLYQACIFGHLDIVKYLVSEGAEIDSSNEPWVSCICACLQTGGRDILEFLLQNGADPNQEFFVKKNPLYFAIVYDDPVAAELLLKYGAIMSKDHQGQTPLEHAAWHQTTGVVDVLVRSKAVTRLQKIEGLELLGAVLVTSGNESLGHRYLCRAMEERYSDPSDILLKPERPPVAAFGCVSESRTLGELESREQDLYSLMMESLSIVERLSVVSERTTRLYREVCSFLGNNGLYDHALALSLHAFEISKGKLLPFILARMCKDFIHLMHANDLSPAFLNIEKLLNYLILDLEESERTTACLPWQHIDQQFIYSSCLFFISVGLHLPKDSEGEARWRNVVQRFLLIRHTICGGLSAPHFTLRACYKKRSRTIVKMDVSAATELIRFLLQCGAKANVVDRFGSSPLHLVAACPPADISLEDRAALTQVLVEAGARLDVRDRAGRTPLDVAPTQEVRDLFRTYLPSSLLRLAATVIVEQGIPYGGLVPELVGDFLKNHSVEEI